MTKGAALPFLSRNPSDLEEERMPEELFFPGRRKMNRAQDYFTPGS